MSSPRCGKCGHLLAQGIHVSECRCVPAAECARCGRAVCVCLVHDPASGTLGEPLNKYLREVKPDVWVDVYDVLGAFTGHYPAQIKPIIDHVTKKLLAGGERGHKDLETDMKDVVASMKRVMEELEEIE